jgi:hypothetical protein
MSGAVAEVLTDVAHQCGGSIPAPLAIKCPVSFSPKAELIYSWISDQAYRLRRAVVVIEKPRAGGLAVFKFDMGG